MKEEKLKEAFYRIKEDIINLGKEVSAIRIEILETNQLMRQINEEIIKLKLEKIAEIPLKSIEESLGHFPTHFVKKQTHPAVSTQTPTHPQEIRGWKTPNLNTSIGNKGVPTDRQTDRQTNQHTNFSSEIPPLVTTKEEKTTKEQDTVVTNNFQDKPIQQQISEASAILDSLDNIKKEIRRKFKRITKQEMLVFSTVYTLEEQDPEGADYKKTALKLNLSESSIRDHIQRMINKGIPILKEKINNKKILLHIAPNLKKIATLDAIVKLREI